MSPSRTMTGAPLSGVGSVCRVCMTVLVAVSIAETVPSVPATRRRVPSELNTRGVGRRRNGDVAGDGAGGGVDDRDGAVEVGDIGLSAGDGDAGRGSPHAGDGGDLVAGQVDDRDGAAALVGDVRVLAVEARCRDGLVPTLMVVVTVLVTVLILVTELEPALTTQTRLPSGLTARPRPDWCRP